VARKLTRGRLVPFFAELAPCVVAMEACSSAHHWARQLLALGFEVRLIPPAHVKPYVRRNKNDAADAAAICEAAGRPGQRFVPVRTIEKQAELMRHRARELLAGQRTAALNALRGHLEILEGSRLSRSSVARRIAAVDDFLGDSLLRPDRVDGDDGALDRNPQIAASKARATGTGDPTLADAGRPGCDQHRRRTTGNFVIAHPISA